VKWEKIRRDVELLDQLILLQIKVLYVKRKSIERNAGIAKEGFLMNPHFTP